MDRIKYVVASLLLWGCATKQDVKVERVIVKDTVFVYQNLKDSIVVDSTQWGLLNTIVKDDSLLSFFVKQIPVAKVDSSFVQNFKLLQDQQNKNNISDSLVLIDSLMGVKHFEPAKNIIQNVYPNILLAQEMYWKYLNILVVQENYVELDSVLIDSLTWKGWASYHKQLSHSLKMNLQGKEKESDRLWMRLRNEYRMSYSWKKAKPTWEYLFSVSPNVELEELQQAFLKRDQQHVSERIQNWKKAKANGEKKEILKTSLDKIIFEYPDFAFDMGYLFLEKELEVYQEPVQKDLQIVEAAYLDQKWLVVLQNTMGIQEGNTLYPKRQKAGNAFCQEMRQEASIKVSQSRIRNGKAKKPRFLQKAVSLLEKCQNNFPEFELIEKINQNILSLQKITNL